MLRRTVLIIATLLAAVAFTPLAKGSGLKRSSRRGYGAGDVGGERRRLTSGFSTLSARARVAASPT